VEHGGLGVTFKSELSRELDDKLSKERSVGFSVSATSDGAFSTGASFKPQYNLPQNTKLPSPSSLQSY